MKHDRDWARSAQRELRAILNDWDPLGVSDPAEPGGEQWLPDDEYDCIRDPLLSHLLRGHDRAEIAAFLRSELEDHFGLPPWLVTTALIDRLFMWWESAR